MKHHCTMLLTPSTPSTHPQEISKAYGVLNPQMGCAYRGLFVIDGRQKIRQITINDIPVGRDVDEAIRLVKAFKVQTGGGERNWTARRDF